MTSVAAPARPHADAVIAALVAAGLLVDRGKQPAGSGWQGTPGSSTFKAYAVLYTSSGVPDGNVADPNAYLDFSFQVTCVGSTGDGAQAISDRVQAALIGRKLAVVGRSSYPVYKTADPIGQRDDAVSPPLHYQTPQFRFRTQAT
ncbi:hypothetical protein [Actinomadura luteofluorescens]|uniref:hypothetical protein n=1 Tax=Actinomadura luteofluorescens TaxID=46163 RepID=UPI003D8E4998